MPPAAGVFDVAAENVVPLLTPTEFYDTLLAGVSSARSRVSLSSLYVGTGTKEVALMAALQRAAAAAVSEQSRSTGGGGSGLQIAIHLDHSRALRPLSAKSYANAPPGAPPVAPTYSCSAALLLELKRAVPAGCDVDVSFTLMPQLRGALGVLLPPRWVEGAAVFHIKAYAWDDCVLLTGANLSDDYFTARQDRYVLIRNEPAFASYIHGVIDALRRLPGTPRLRADGVVAADGTPSPPPTGGTPSSSSLPPIVSIRPGLGVFNAYVLALRALLRRASSAAEVAVRADGTVALPPPGRATLAPRLQLGWLGVRADEAATLQLFARLPPAPAARTHDKGWRGVLHMATGYFNLPGRYARAVVDGSAATSHHLLTSAPAANGFLGGAGMSAAIPLCYSIIEGRFVARVAAARRAHDNPTAAPAAPGVTMYEYSRPGWTFHGKGLWLALHCGDTTSNASAPPDAMLTFVGSPNFGRRSVSRDLELQVEVATSDAGLVRRLGAERAALFSSGANGQVVTPMTPADFAAPDRNPSGSSLATGQWIHLGWRLFSPFF